MTRGSAILWLGIILCLADIFPVYFDLGAKRITWSLEAAGWLMVAVGLVLVRRNHSI